MDNGYLSQRLSELINELMDLRNDVIKSHNTVKVTKPRFTCDMCDVGFVAAPNFAAHLKEFHSTADEEILVMIANQELFYESGLIQLKNLLSEYTQMVIEDDEI